jgi:hypothetical protein
MANIPHYDADHKRYINKTTEASGVQTPHVILDTPVKAFFIEVSRGNVAGYTSVHKFGRNVAAGTSEVQIQFGGGTLVPLTAAVTMEAVSDDANDTVAGSNARTIRIWGVDGNFNAITEDITLAGLSASAATTQTFLRVYKGRVLTTGTYNTKNAGNISIRVSSAGAIQATLVADISVTETTHYTIANGYTGYLVRVAIDVDSSKTSRIVMHCRGNTNLTVAPFDPVEHVHTWDGVSGEVLLDLKGPHVFTAKTDIWFTSEAGSVNTPLEVNYDLILVQDGY